MFKDLFGYPDPPPPPCVCVNLVFTYVSCVLYCLGFFDIYLNFVIIYFK